MKLLVSNVGSTSLKFKLFDMPEERVLCEAKIERVGSRDAAIMSYRSHLSGARFSAEGLCIPSYAEGIALFLEKLTGDETGVIKGVEEISAIGFKTVLSRGYYGVHELTDEVMENMREYLYIAPVHNAAYIEAIGQFRAVLPDVPMIGVFETAFHREIPLERALYSIPYEWYEKYGIRKMGYHGASHGYIAQQAAKLGRAERVISCHLGGSCSICAILDGKSVDNSFGFSLQTGVMHANRAGDIDPYIVPFLMSKGMELDDILHGLSKNGGLLGVSGALAELGLGLGDIDWLVSTHCHGDHIGGHARIKELAPQIRTACIEQAAPALRDPAANAVRIRTKYPRFSPPPQCYLRGVEPDRVLRDGEALGDRLTVLHTPGHDGDCVCWYDRKTKTAVTGDSLQANGTVTQGIAFYQDLDAYLGSVAKLRTCDVENIIAGHDYAGMGYNIEGAENVRRVLDLCAAYTEQYQRFVDEALSCGLTDTSVMAAQMITQLGCGMPQKLFLAMYTTDEHIRHSKFYKGELK